MVKIIVDHLNLGDRGARLAIRGYGGIGKTSVALAVCHHPKVQAAFERRRFFVECDTAETPTLLLQEIGSCLQIDLSQGNAIDLIILSDFGFAQCYARPYKERAGEAAYNQMG
jgi:hypothetical protein